MRDYLLLFPLEIFVTFGVCAENLNPRFHLHATMDVVEDNISLLCYWGLTKWLVCLVY
jgi:hypothetical protein